MGKHNEFGRFGEEVAEDFLRNRGYKILQKNYYYTKAEVDIIAQKDDTLAIIEVKSRSRGFFKDMSEVVHPKKIKLLVKAADHYVIENDLDVEVRFDIITVIKKDLGFEVEHLEDAFHHF
nr:YraN family protein [Allomuricauda sp.]